MSLFCDNCTGKIEQGSRPPADCNLCSVQVRKGKAMYLCLCDEKFFDIATKLEHMEKCKVARAIRNRPGPEAATSHNVKVEEEDLEPAYD